jgi:hypothetical protein
MADIEDFSAEMQGMGEEMQDMFDAELPIIRGMFSETAMNALVDASNAALEAAGFEGDYPEFDSNVTEFPSEFMRLIMMLTDAAEESGAPVTIELGNIEDDRDVALLASELKRLSQSAEFKRAMTGGMEEEIDVEESPEMGGMMAVGEVPMDEEALMISRM